jgi:hypothetical protein
LVISIQNMSKNSMGVNISSHIKLKFLTLEITGLHMGIRKYGQNQRKLTHLGSLLKIDIKSPILIQNYIY